jgi:hypothetical protein
VSDQTGNREATVDALRASARLAEAADMQLYAAAARYQLGRLLGGIEGEGILERAEDAMAVQEIRAPARFAGMLVPIPSSAGARSSERSAARGSRTPGPSAPMASTADRR